MKQTVAVDPTDPNTTFRYGLGLWRVNDVCGANWGHTGTIFGYQSLAFWNERTGRTVVIASTMFPAPAAAESPLATATDLALCAKAKEHVKSTLLGDTNHIEVRGLRRVYGTGEGAFEAVRGIDLVVEAGTIVALLGTNGAGKTSALEVVEGLARPTAGEVRVLGMDPVTDRAEVRRRTGVLLQTSGFPADLTVAETLRMWASTMTSARPVAHALADSILSAAPTYGCEACPAASSGASTWLARCSGIPRSCCSTNRPPGSTPKVGAGSGTSSQPCGIGVGRCS